jgi:hypothetical protein
MPKSKLPFTPLRVNFCSIAGTIVSEPVVKYDNITKKDQLQCYMRTYWRAEATSASDIIPLLIFGKISQPGSVLRSGHVKGALVFVTGRLNGRHVKNAGVKMKLATNFINILKWPRNIYSAEAVQYRSDIEPAMPAELEAELENPLLFNQGKLKADLLAFTQGKEVYEEIESDLDSGNDITGRDDGEYRSFLRDGVLTHLQDGFSESHDCSAIDSDAGERPRRHNSAPEGSQGDY